VYVNHGLQASTEDRRQHVALFTDCMRRFDLSDVNVTHVLRLQVGSAYAVVHLTVYYADRPRLAESVGLMYNGLTSVRPSVTLCSRYDTI